MTHKKRLDIPRLFSLALLMLALLGTPALAQHQHHGAPASSAEDTTSSVLRGVVIDASTRAPLPYATLHLHELHSGVASDLEGRFELSLPEGTYTLHVSSVGYETRNLAVSAPDELVIALTIKTYQADEVIVQSRGGVTRELAASPENLNATEDLMQHVSGVAMVQRANYAWEPVIRGMSGGQVGLVIDGMKVYGACVDKMDPASSYIEPENLARLEVSRGGFDLSKASQVGGTVNLVTQKPAFSQPYDLEAEVGYESVSTLGRVRLQGGASWKDLAVRGSYSYRKADDFSPGGSDPIPFSGFEKRNYSGSLAWQMSTRSTLSASFLGDDAWMVGYPVLLMDATLAQARIGSISYEQVDPATGITQIQSRLYYNQVDHWMDDRYREVAERGVMRGMYMPMYGNTRTYGLISDLRHPIGAAVWTLTLDAHQVSQFGDMWMYSIFPGVADMYLLNMGDVEATNYATTLQVNRPIQGRAQLNASVRWDGSARRILRADMQRIFAARYGTSSTEKTYGFPSASLALTGSMRPGLRWRVALASTARLPTNVENFGHYIYNYVDGFFYTGNPTLKPERAHQLEAQLDVGGQHVAARITGYVSQLRDAIVGLPDPGLTESTRPSGSYAFRIYSQTDRALSAGFESSIAWHISDALEMAGSISYAYAHLTSLDEPMPMIPPVTGYARIIYRSDQRWIELEGRGAGPQNRVSFLADEDVTDGFFVTHLRAGGRLTPWSGGTSMTVRIGLENVFDVRYHEHLSIGNLPARGRNVVMALTYVL